MTVKTFSTLRLLQLIMLIATLILFVSLVSYNAFRVVPSHHFSESLVSRQSSSMRSLVVLTGFQSRLHDGYLEKIELVREDFKSLSSITNRNDDEAKRYKQCKVILDCIDALTSIDRDLVMFSEHLEGDDENLRSTAKVFVREFTECKEQMVDQLNKLL